MNDSTIQDVGIMRLNGETYKIVRPDFQTVAYEREYANGAPWQSGEPPEVSTNGFTWHLGGFKSRAGAVGTSEYGENTDGSWPLKLLPGPQVNELILDDSKTMTVQHITNTTPDMYFICGRYIYRTDGTFVPVLSKDLGVGVNAVQGFINLDGKLYVATDAATRSLWRQDAVNVGGPDTWTQTTDAIGLRFAVGINRTFRITSAGVLSNCRAGLDIMVNANWGDAVQMGASTYIPQALETFERTVLVGKQDGLFSVGEEGFGVPEIKRMAASVNNTHAMRVFDPYLMVPHARGLFRWSPGEAVLIGLETETLNQSPVRGPIVALATDGKWVYYWIQNGTTIWLNRFRERERTEQVSSAYIHDTWVVQTGMTGDCLWGHFNAGIPYLGVPSRLWWGVGKRVYYINLGSAGGVTDYLDTASYRFATTGGTRYTAKMNFDDRNTKDFRRVQMEVFNCTAAKYWSVAYAVDGGAFQTVDINGAAMECKSDGLFDFYLPSTAVGRELQLKFTWVSNSTTSPPELRYWEAFAVPQSKKLARTSVYLILQEGFQTDGGFEDRTALQQLDALQSLLVSPIPVQSSGPWGDEVVTVKDLRIQTTLQGGEGVDSFLAKLTMQERASV